MIADRLGRSVAVTAVFALAGPFIGTAVVMVVTAARVAGWDGELLVRLIGLFSLFGIALGFLIGLVPAALTGLVAALISPWLKTPWAWVAGAGVAGLLVSLAFFRMTELSVSGAMMVSAGALSAMACALMTVRLRPV